MFWRATQSNPKALLYTYIYIYIYRQTYIYKDVQVLYKDRMPLTNNNYNYHTYQKKGKHVKNKINR